MALQILTLRLLRGLIPGAIVWVTARLVNAIATRDAGDVAQFLVFELMLAMPAVILQHISTYKEFVFAEMLSARMSKTVAAAAIRLDLEEIESPGWQDAIERANRAASRGAVGQAVFNGFQAVITVTSIWAAAFMISPGIVGILSVVSVAAGVLQLRTASWGYQVNATIAPERRKLDYLRRTASLPTSAKDIRSYFLHDYLMRSYERTAARILTAVQDLALRNCSVAAALSIATTLLFYCAAGWFAYLAVLGDASVGEFVASLAAFRASQDAISNGALFIRDIKEHSLHVQDIDLLIRAARPNGQTCERSSLSSVVLYGVGFTYRGGSTPAVQDLNLTLRKGSRIALVGRNGSGKSTVVKLLAGLYAPSNGSIYVDGKRADDLNILRSNVAIVFQDPLRLEATIEENIAFGVPPSRDVVWLGEGAGLDSELGLKTSVGELFEGATQLSGGQWQYVAIARALNKGASFLVFDEPDAALDPRAEAQLLSLLSKMPAAVGVVVVTHRMRVLAACDQVILMEKGRVVASGTHKDLQQSSPAYRQFCALKNTQDTNAACLT